jgi:hypothetical protein
MKLTKSILKRIIQEELKAVLSEGSVGAWQELGRAIGKNGCCTEDPAEVQQQEKKIAEVHKKYPQLSDRGREWYCNKWRDTVPEEAQCQ